MRNIPRKTINPCSNCKNNLFQYQNNKNSFQQNRYQNQLDRPILDKQTPILAPERISIQRNRSKTPQRICLKCGYCSKPHHKESNCWLKPANKIECKNCGKKYNHPTEKCWRPVNNKINTVVDSKFQESLKTLEKWNKEQETLLPKKINKIKIIAITQ